MKSKCSHRCGTTLLPCCLLLLLLCACLVAMSTAHAQVRHRGIDVSRYQGNINWSKVARDSTIRFVYIKATEGATLQDQRYTTNLTNARKAGLLAGSYHVYSNRSTAYQQMANIRKVVKKAKQDLIPVLDIEASSARNLNMKRVDRLLELMEKEYGVKPMIYTSESIYRSHFRGQRYRKYHFFIANYRRYPGVNFTLWQYTSTGHCAGISGNVDFSRLHRSRTLGDIRMPKPKTQNADTQQK